MFAWIKEQLEVSHGKNTPLLSMEGLRGIAVFLVFWVHYGFLVMPFTGDKTLGTLNFISNAGHLGVDLFFVLSGYLIYRSIISRESFSVIPYCKRRIGRIYPTFLVVFSAYLVLSFVFPSESKLPSGGGKALVYVISNLLLLPGIFPITPIITAAWSLSYEVFYYILVPIIVLLLGMKSWKVNVRILFWVVVAAIGFVLHYFFDGPVRLLMFIAGILLYELYHNKEITFKKGGTVSLLLGIVLFGINGFSSDTFTFTCAIIFILFLYGCLCALNPDSHISRWLVFTPLRWFGNMSYSYYLIHGVTLKVIFIFLRHVFPLGYRSEFLFYWLWIPCFLITVMVAFGLFVMVERPFSLIKGGRDSGKNFFKRVIGT